MTMTGTFFIAIGCFSCSVMLSSDQLLEKAFENKNLHKAYRKTIATKTKCGIDHISREQLPEYLIHHWKNIKKELLTDAYLPSPVFGVRLAKKGGTGCRIIGIPTFTDRVIQRSLLPVLSSFIDPFFSDLSYGYRVGRSRALALKKAKEYIAQGKEIVVNIDIEKFFDHIDHEILLKKVSAYVHDVRIVNLIKKYLKAGVQFEDEIKSTEQGVCQGHPLSPLLANIYLDELDQEMEKKGYAFIRFSDDCTAYVSTQEEANNLFDEINNFLDERLKLRVNQKKSKILHASRCKFLGRSYEDDGSRSIVKSKKKSPLPINVEWLKQVEVESKTFKRNIWAHCSHMMENMHYTGSIDTWVNNKFIEYVNA